MKQRGVKKHSFCRPFFSLHSKDLVDGTEECGKARSDFEKCNFMFFHSKSL